MFRIRKSDMVKVISGNYKGKSGRVLKVYPKTERVIVEGINFIKRHTRPSQNNPQGGIVEKEASIHVSNIQILFSNKPTKVGYRTLKDGKKVRYSKETGEVIDAN